MLSDYETNNKLPFSHISTSPLNNTQTLTLTLTLTLTPTSTPPLALHLNPTPPLTVTKPFTLSYIITLIPTIRLTLTVSGTVRPFNITTTFLKPNHISYACAGMGPQTLRKHKEKYTATQMQNA